MAFSIVFFTLSLPLGYSSLSLSFLFLPLASPSLFFRTSHGALAVAPALCAPARVARAMASDFHANLNVAAGVVSGTLTACGSTPLAVWGALPKRRGNAGSDSELPCHMNTFFEVRWDCVFESSRSCSRSRSHCAIYPTAPPRARTRNSCPLTSITLSPFLLFVFVFVFVRLRLRLRLPLCLIFFLFVIPSFLFFFTSASSSWCFSSLLSSSSHLFPPLLIHVGSSHLGVQLSCWEE